MGLGFFLHSRLVNGTVLFYVNRRLAWLTLLAAVGLIAVGASYLYQSARSGASPIHSHGAVKATDDHPRQRLSAWFSLFLVALPVALGLIVPPQPLGAVALGKRQVGPGSLVSAASPGSDAALVTRDEQERTVLDWAQAFGQNPDPAAFTGQEAHVVGFVYRDERFEADSFMVGRFVVTCCVADATAVGLVVRWPEAAALAQDQWVEVGGQMAAGEWAGEQMPVLVARTVTPVEPLDQPYLYP